MSTFSYDFFDNFDTRWQEVYMLIERANGIKDSDQQFYNSLCRASIVLSVANFEGYLNEVINMILKDINKFGAFRDASYPLKQTFCSAFVNIEEKGNGNKIKKLIETFDDLEVKFQREPFLFEGNKNPKALVIEKLFKKMGGNDFWSFVSNCEIEKVFENDKVFNEKLISDFKHTILISTDKYPYGLIDIKVLGFNNTDKGKHPESMWKAFLDETLRKRHMVAHGTTFDNEISINELLDTITKLKVLELSFAILVLNDCLTHHS